MLFRLFSFAALAAVASAQNLTAVLTSTPELSKLTSLASQYPDLVKALSSAEDVTILAPNNAAFDKYLTPTILRLIQQYPKIAEAVLTYHVLRATVPASAFVTAPAFIPTLLESPDLTNVTGGQVVEGFAKGKDIEIVSGLRKVSTVVKGDIEFDGGLIHIIDTVLTTPISISETALLAGLTDLAAALVATGLVETVDTTSDLTVFAPDNAAFKKVASQVSKLTTAQLTGILGYHAVKGPIGYSSKLKNGQTLTTTTGEKVTITISGGNIFVNDAKVIVPDVLVANGVVHIIDSVLSPPSGGSNSTGGAGTPTASGSPTGATGTGTSYPPTGSPISYQGAASSMKAGVLGFAVVCAASFWLTV
ncbi:hypothetical protein MMC07_001322 [Pseudocyphellaria aurata]|nr:hypothetical protein [Pseudocyphellaria aurata]